MSVRRDPPGFVPISEYANMPIPHELGTVNIPPEPPVVAWTTPFQRAEASFRLAGVLLEDKRKAQALAALLDHLRQTRLLIDFIQVEGLEAPYAPKDRHGRG